MADVTILLCGDERHWHSEVPCVGPVGAISPLQATGCDLDPAVADLNCAINVPRSGFDVVKLRSETVTQGLDAVPSHLRADAHFAPARRKPLDDNRSRLPDNRAAKLIVHQAGKSQCRRSVALVDAKPTNEKPCPPSWTILSKAAVFKWKPTLPAASQAFRIATSLTRLPQAFTTTSQSVSERSA